MISRTTGEYRLNNSVFDARANIYISDDGKIVSQSTLDNKKPYWSLGGTVSGGSSSDKTCYCSSKSSTTCSLILCLPVVSEGYCWQKGTSFCLVCGIGEYQDNEEDASGSSLSICSGLAPTDMVPSPYIAPRGSCKQIDKGCYSVRAGMTFSCPNGLH